jgi:hypothetical protein
LVGGIRLPPAIADTRVPTRQCVVLDTPTPFKIAAIAVENALIAAVEDANVTVSRSVCSLQ